MIILDIQAFDWNCPQHITQRYTTEEINLAFAPQQKYVSDLVAENKKLTEELRNLNESSRHL
jgi:hypothetical protein